MFVRTIPCDFADGGSLKATLLVQHMTQSEATSGPISICIPNRKKHLEDLLLCEYMRGLHSNSYRKTLLTFFCAIYLRTFARPLYGLSHLVFTQPRCQHKNEYFRGLHVGVNAGKHSWRIICVLVSCQRVSCGEPKVSEHTQSNS